MHDKPLSEQESLQLISTMINKAKDVYHDTGWGAILWGAVIAVCSIVSFLEQQFSFKLPFDIYLLTLLAIIPQIIIVIKQNRMRKAKTYDDVYLDSIWLAFGISIFLLVHINNHVFHAWQPVAKHYKELTGVSSGFRYSEFVMPLFLMLYGIPTFITGKACRFSPMLWGGIVCWVGSVVACYTTMKADLLITATAAIVAWFIPGLIMLKEYRAAKRLANV
jgi:hypothetical protein